jgi:hypothetical protein
LIVLRFFDNHFIYLKDYVDDTEPLWQHFCVLHFKDAQREECESFYDLYWVKEIEDLCFYIRISCL